MKKDILQTILAHKYKEVAAQQEAVSLSQLEQMLGVPKPGLSMQQALKESPHGIIAEFKRRSPSKEWIHRKARPEEVTPAYQQAGAAALSVLTDEIFFGGNMTDLRTTRSLVTLPLLRKEFIISPYQLFQTKLLGADVVLLIAACLSPSNCKELAKLARELQLEVLLEIHEERELEYMCEEISLVGINNRNLGTFHTDVENSFRLASHLPKEVTLVSESGISQTNTVKQLREAGFRGFLMGECFMKALHPGNALADFIQSLQL